MVFIMDSLNSQYFNGYELPEGVVYKNELWNNVTFLYEWGTYHSLFTDKNQ